MLWSRSRPEQDFFAGAGAGENEPAPGCYCVGSEVAELQLFFVILENYNNCYIQCCGAGPTLTRLRLQITTFLVYKFMSKVQL